MEEDRRPWISRSESHDSIEVIAPINKLLLRFLGDIQIVELIIYSVLHFILQSQSDYCLCLLLDCVARK